MTSHSQVLAVDVCGTLYDANTTAGFIRHHHKLCQNTARQFFLFLITARYLPVKYALILFAKLFKFDLHRTLCVLTLRDQSRSSLEHSAQDYVAALNAVKIDEAHARIATLQADGWHPVLVSNSIDIIIHAIATKMNIGYVASQLAWQKDKSSGRIQVDLTGIKRLHLEEYLGASLEKISFAVITDNRSDRDLIKCAIPAMLVAKVHKKQWMEEHDNAEIIYHRAK